MANGIDYFLQINLIIIDVMKIIDNIEKYYSLIDDKKDWYLERYKKADFIFASKLFILYNANDQLLEILSIYSNNNRIQLNSLIESNDINSFFKTIEEMRNDLKNEFILVEKEITNFVKSLDKTDETILNNILDNLLKEVIEHEFKSKRIFSENKSDYVYIFSRMNEKQKKKLALIIDDFNMKVNKIISDF